MKSSPVLPPSKIAYFQLGLKTQVFTIEFDIQQFYILPTEYVYLFMYPRKIGDVWLVFITEM